MSEVLVEHDNGLVIITINRPEARNAVESRRVVRRVRGGRRARCPRRPARRHPHRRRRHVLLGHGPQGVPARRGHPRRRARHPRASRMTPPKQAAHRRRRGLRARRRLRGGARVRPHRGRAQRAVRHSRGQARPRRRRRRPAAPAAPDPAAHRDGAGADRRHDERGAAAQFGLVNVLAEPGRRSPKRSASRRRIIANAPLSIAASKRVIVESRDWPIAEMFARQRAITEPVLQSADAREGAAAFAEKRAPNWKGN